MLAWSATTGGKIDSNGVFVSNAEAGICTVTVSAGNPLVRASAILMLTPAVKPITLIQPNGGERFFTGDTMFIMWKTTGTTVGSVDILITLDDGRSWSSILQATGAIGVGSAWWGKFPWVIPAEIDGTELTNQQGQIMVRSYVQPYPFDNSDSAFVINPPTSVIR